MTPVPFTIKPGQAGPWRSVQQMLREQHDEARKATDEAIAQRRAKGIPLDNLPDWRAAVGDVLDEVETAKDRDAVVALLSKASGIASGPLRPLDPYEPAPELDGVEVRLRSLSRVDVMEMQATLAAAHNGDDLAAVLRGNAETHKAMRNFLRKCLVGVRGVELESGRLEVDRLDSENAGALDDVISLLDEGGFLPAFFMVARAYMVMPPLRRRLSGLSGLSTSEPMSARTAPQHDDRPSAAKAAHLAPSSVETHDSKPTPAHAPTSTDLASAISLSTSIAGPLQTSSP